MEELERGVLKEVMYFAPMVTRSSEPVTVNGATTSVIFRTSAEYGAEEGTVMSFYGIGKLVGFRIGDITFWVNCPFGDNNANIRQ
jgi:hypothetical protein